VAGCRDRRDDVAGGGLDLVDARFGDLVEVGAVEGRAGVAGASQRAHGLAAFGVERDERGAGRGPDIVAIVSDAVHVLGAGEGAVFAHDFGRARRCLGPILVGLAGHRLSPFIAPWIGAVREL